MNTKKTTLYIVSFLFSSIVCLAAGNPGENPNVPRSFGITRSPSNTPTQSGKPQRFLTRPGSNSYGQTGNDIVTGNVGGGKHFRGVVPYGSSYYSGAYSSSSGTAAVNRFMQRAANPIANDRNPGQVGRYYDPRRTVSSTQQRPDGSSGLTTPKTASQWQKKPNITQDMLTYSIPKTDLRPLSNNNMDLEQILARQEELYQQDRKPAPTNEEEPDRMKDFFKLDTMPQPEPKDEKDPNKEEQTEPQPQSQSVTDILAELNKTLDEQQETESEITPAPEPEPEPDPDPAADLRSPKSKLLPELDPEMLEAAREQHPLGEYKTYNEMAEAKFSGYMKAAEDFINKGQFYKAADAYSLAVMWKPDDARGYMGQSFSLFAAGEYMSSAYYLSLAFELNPTVAENKYNLVKFIGDRDTFENRILEMTTWQERSGAGELSFLMAYISYQDDKAVRAVNAIKKAKEIMPDSRAVTILKHIIDPEPLIK